MLALIAFVLAALCFLFAALGTAVGDLRLVDWGLFFLALGLLLGPAVAFVASRRSQ